MSKLLVPALALILGAAGGAAATLVIDRIHAVDPASEARAGEDMVRALLARDSRRRHGRHDNPGS